MLYLIAYGIAGDRSREHMATLLSGYGPRVPRRMWGCELRSRREAIALGAKLRALIDAIADQVRIYLLDERTARGVVVLGARVTGERQDFWVVW